jgi:SAM-dependent methyltransferase
MYEKITNCRCCGSNDLSMYLDLGSQPLANSYHKGEELPAIPLEVMYCKQCYHNQLSVVVKPEIMFKNYLYVSGTTVTFREHCKNLAHDAVNYYNARLSFLTMDCWVAPDVLDIACNDGTLLTYFKQIGCNVKGVDPAENLRAVTKEKGLDVVVDYWRSDIDLGQQFDIITGTNVFAHVHDVKGFLSACVRHLKDRGHIILEFPYCQQMLEKCEFDTVYHEHLSYFLVTPFFRLIESFKELRVHDIKLTPIHGGSIRFILQKRQGMHCGTVHGMIEYEDHLLHPGTFQAFSKSVEKQKHDLLEWLGNCKGTVVGYGASAKGNTMLNYFGIDLKYIVDDNPLKWGLMTPGRNIPIRSPKELAKENDLYVLLLAWNFAEEIKKRVGAIREAKETRFVHYVPHFMID